MKEHSDERKNHKSEFADERRIANDLKRELAKALINKDDHLEIVKVLVNEIEMIEVECAQWKQWAEEAYADQECSIKEERANSASAVNLVLNKMKILKQKNIALEAEQENAIAELEVKKNNTIATLEMEKELEKNDVIVNMEMEKNDIAALKSKHKDQILELERQKADVTAALEDSICEREEKLQKERRCYEIIVQKEWDSTCVIIKSMEGKLAATIRRKLENRAESINFTLEISSSKVEDLKVQLCELKSSWNDREKSIQAEMEEIHDSKLSAAALKFEMYLHGISEQEQRKTSDAKQVVQVTKKKCYCAESRASTCLHSNQ